MVKLKLMPAVPVVLACVVSGCKMAKAVVMTAALAVGLAGYVVYKTGDAAVTGVGKAAEATGDAVSSGSKSVATVIYANGELTVEYPYDVRTLWLTAGLALRKAGFIDVKGSFDALSGELAARTRENVGLTFKMKVVETHATELRIRVGVKGDLKTAELINSLIVRELPKPVSPAPSTPAPANIQEAKQ
jgi:hypothetical protein